MSEQRRGRGRPSTGKPKRLTRSVKLDPAWLSQAERAAARNDDTVSDLANRAVGAYAQLHGEGWDLAGEIAELPGVTRTQEEVFDELVGIVADIQWQRGRGPDGARASLLLAEDIASNSAELDAWLIGAPEAEFPGWCPWRWGGEQAPVLSKGAGYRLVMLGWAVARSVRWALRLN